ncbi:MAG: aminotransferase class I/II-fold pyridoxal phosphate-dependent enzyme [Dysgonamonadaceae bacterium]|nr:aminotransferase class I/II-fold pyridoxal phosphate-dependent enzyme [Dysgonamonadaceae bacterium]
MHSSPTKTSAGKKRIHLSLAHIGSVEQEFVLEAFDAGWVTSLGPNVDGFEHDIASFLGENVRVAALSAGTAALHLGLILLGVGAGDEVICQSFTFSASANPIKYLGAKPVFVDSEKTTWNMSSQLLETAIEDRIRKTGKRPKAIIPVHIYGMPARMNEILAIAKHYDIPVLEDAAEALGSKYENRACGTFGDIAALSFNGNKIITTSGGGALVSVNSEFVSRAIFLASQARDAAPYYQHSHVGYNYRLSNVCAGIGRGQMMVLPDRVERRRANNLYYRNRLSGITGIEFQTEPDGCFSNYWLTAMLVNPDASGGITCEYLREALEKENIESRPLWKPLHLQPVFADCPFYGDGTCESLFERGICLPSGSTLTETDLFRVTDIINRTID